METALQYRVTVFALILTGLLCRSAMIRFKWNLLMYARLLCQTCLRIYATRESEYSASSTASAFRLRCKLRQLLQRHLAL